MRASTLSRIRNGMLAAAALAALAQPPATGAQETVALDRWPSERAHDPAALQRGARLFVNYCLNCHGARMMRWNRLREIGIDDAQIRALLIFGDQKVGDTMTVAMNPVDAKLWFGKAPPDLSVIVRARSTAEHRGTDYIYTLLRGFYRDRSTLTGWNNIVYPSISMPNVLWERQGGRSATFERLEAEEHAGGGAAPGGSELVRITSVYDADGYVQVTRTGVANGAPGVEVHFAAADAQRAAAYDGDVADLVAYLNWMSEPSAGSRYRIGVWVMGFLVVFLMLSRWLNKVYWRDIR